MITVAAQPPIRGYFISARIGFLGAWYVAVMALPLTSYAGAVPAGTPEEVGLSTERLQRVTQVMSKHIEAGDVAGAVTLVARRGRIAHLEAQGFADIESRTPMSTDNIFRLASMSKPITAVAVMMLVEEGEIRLSDPVSRFIPELSELTKVAVPRPNGPEDTYDLVTAARAITVGDLLKHGSGLVSGGLGADAAAELAPQTPRDTLATYIPKLAAVPLDFQPGTLWRYSGLAGFNVLSRIVEVVSGQTFDEFLEERLFAPLGMPDTAFYFADDARARRVATIYTRSPEGLQPNPQQQLDRVYFSGAGGLEHGRGLLAVCADAAQRR